MKKLLHNELHEAASACRRGELSLDLFFGKLIQLLRDHFENLGLSEKAFRYWSCEDSPELWREVKGEFSRQGVAEGIAKANQWLAQAASTSKAFKIRFSDKGGGTSETQTPTFRSLAWQYHSRKVAVDSPNEPTADLGPMFYTPPIKEGDLRVVRRPWV